MILTLFIYNVQFLLIWFFNNVSIKQEMDQIMSLYDGTTDWSENTKTSYSNTFYSTVVRPWRGLEGVIQDRTDAWASIRWNTQNIGSSQILGLVQNYCNYFILYNSYNSFASSLRNALLQKSKTMKVKNWQKYLFVLT